MKRDVKTQSQIELGLDIMGYTRVQGALPVDLEDGPLAAERIQQLALPKDKWLGPFEVDDALSNLSWQVCEQMGAGKKKLNLTKAIDKSNIAELMRGQQTPAEWTACRHYLQRHWRHSFLSKLALNIHFWELPPVDKELRPLMVIPDHNVAIRFHLHKGNIYLHYNGLAFISGFDTCVLKPALGTAESFLRLGAVSNLDSQGFERIMLDQVGIDMANGCLQVPKERPLYFKKLMEYLSLDGAINSIEWGSYIDSIDSKWRYDGAVGGLDLESVLTKMDFVSGFPTVVPRFSAITLPVTMNEIRKEER